MARKSKKQEPPPPPPERPVTPSDVLFEVMEPFLSVLGGVLQTQTAAAIQPIVGRRKRVEVLETKSIVRLRMTVEPGGLGSGTVSLDFDVVPEFHKLNADKWLRTPWDGSPPTTSRHAMDQDASMGRPIVEVFEVQMHINHSAGNRSPKDALRLAELLRQVGLLALQLETLTEEWLHDHQVPVGEKLRLKLTEIREDQIARGIIQVAAEEAATPA